MLNKSVSSTIANDKQKGHGELKKGAILTDYRQIRSVLEESEVIAVLGLSPKPERDSHRVARYMQKAGYRILPVRPAQKNILGERVYRALEDIEGPVDIVDAFRTSEQVMAHVPEVTRIRPRVFWMQLGIENRDAANQLTDAGIDVVMNRCIKVDHENLYGKKIIV